MLRLRQWLWPFNRLAIGILLYLIWAPFVVMLIVYVSDNEDGDGQATEQASELAVTDEDEPDDFAETVGWTWGVLWIGYAGLAAWLASIKGRDPVRWGLVSLLTFIALFPLLAVAPDRRRE